MSSLRNDAIDLRATVAGVYMSCDKYSDIWDGYFKLFHRFWPDCPFDIHVLSNTREPSDPGLKPLCVGADVSWSDNLINALERLRHEYVFLLLDDVFITAPVPHEYVVDRLTWGIRQRVACLRLAPSNPRPLIVDGKSTGHIPIGAIYRTSTRFPLWNRRALIGLLQRGETAWQFEIDGSVRSDALENFYAIVAEPFQFSNTIIKGEWNPVAVRKLRSLGVELDLSRRPMMSTSKCLLEGAKIVRSSFLHLVPYRARRRVRAAVLNAFR